jgi:hypothetical protein
MTDTSDLIRQRLDALHPVLDEQARRRFAAAEARALGHGGVTLVSKVTGIARSTINRGIAEIETNRSAGEGRVRRPGGGRRPKTQEDPTLLDDLQKLLEASTRHGGAMLCMDAIRCRRCCGPRRASTSCARR